MQALAAFLKEKESLFAGIVPDANSMALRYQALETVTARQTIYKKLPSIMATAKKSFSLMYDNVAELAEAMGGEVCTVNVKNDKSAERKVLDDYDGDATLLCDALRGDIIIPSENVPLARAVLALHNSTCSVKDLFKVHSKTGVALLNSKVKLKNGLVVEAQIKTPGMHEAMILSHPNYKKINDYVTAFANAAIPPEISLKINELRKDCLISHATGALIDGLDRYLDKPGRKSHNPRAFVN